MRIREIRRSRNLTQQQLADAIGVNYSVISKYESGRIAPPAGKLARMAKVLDVSVDDLLGDRMLRPTYRASMAEDSSFVDEDSDIVLEAGGQKRYYSARDVKAISNFALRSQETAQYVLRRADGHCELCGCEAPFMNPDGSPYLEIHHIVWLKDGGEPVPMNTVALCPNCHRRMHVLRRMDDVSKLIEAAAEPIR